MKARLLTNLIASGGVFIERGSVVDDDQVPQHLRETILDYDLQNREGRVLALHDISFQTIPKADSSGTLTSYPRQVMAGAVFKLEQVPASHRASFVEGQDFKREWTEEEQKELLRVGEDAYAKQFETPMPTGVSRWVRR
jgi:hypothetical protein